MRTYLFSQVAVPQMKNCLDLYSFIIRLSHMWYSMDIYDFLKKEGYLDENYMPTETSLKQNVFRTAEVRVTVNGNNMILHKRVFITKDGMISIFRKLLTQQIASESAVG